MLSRLHVLVDSMQLSHLGVVTAPFHAYYAGIGNRWNQKCSGIKSAPCPISSMMLGVQGYVAACRPENSLIVQCAQSGNAWFAYTADTATGAMFLSPRDGGKRHTSVLQARATEAATQKYPTYLHII